MRALITPTDILAKASIVAGLTALVLVGADFLLGQSGRHYPLLILLPAAFVASQWLLPASRFSLAEPLSPMNFVLGLFAMHLVGFPILFVLLGPARGQLPAIPSDASMNQAFVLEVISYVACLVGAVIVDSRVRRPQRGSATFAPRLSRGFVIAFALIGLTGLVLRFGSVDGLVDYFTLQRTVGKTALTGFDRLAESAASVLLPALGCSAVLLFAYWLDVMSSRHLKYRREAAGVVAAFVFLLFAYSVYNYNRAALIVPAVALAGAYSIRVRRISVRLLMGVATVLALVALVFGSVRAATERAQVGVRPVNPLDAELNVSQVVQSYGSAPQFTAYMLDSGRGERLFLGGSLVASILHPLPIVGRDFRPNSDVTIYNRDIYGSDISVDQVVPFKGELYWNFWYLGVAFGFILLGMAVRRVDNAYLSASNGLAAYVWSYSGIWLGFLVVGSIAVLSQIAFYFMWPFALYAAWHWFSSRNASSRLRVRALKGAKVQDSG